MAAAQPSTFIETARQRLKDEWQTLANQESVAPADAAVPEKLASAVRRSINSKTQTYRYVLPTQLLAKLVDGELDCRCIQAGSGLKKAFDARSLCHKVIVEFDRNNNNVLGGSAEPYLNNPLRIQAILPKARNSQRDKAGFDDLRLVLDYAQKQPSSIGSLVHAVLLAIRDRLAAVSVAYPVPNRLSVKQTTGVIKKFLAQKTGGLRLQIVTLALFLTVGRRFGLFDDVRSANINAADIATGSAADMECLDADGAVMLAVEVKDRQLRLTDAQSKLLTARSKSIRELLFIVQGGTFPADTAAITQLIDHEFVTGQNLYILEFQGFLDNCLVLFGESGRAEFVRQIGQELEKAKTDIGHRREWATILGEA
jgi:hypothetical protein